MIRKVKRIISSAVLATFLLNTFLLDIGFAQDVVPKNSTDTLAPAAITDDMLGSELRDQNRILIWFKACIAIIEAKKLPVNLDSIKDPVILDDDFFNDLSGFQIFRHEAQGDPETGAIRIMARKLDPAAQSYIMEYDPSSGSEERLRVYPKEDRRVANNGARPRRTVDRYVKAPKEGKDTTSDPRPLNDAQKADEKLMASNGGSSKAPKTEKREIVKMDENVIKTVIKLLADKSGLRSQDPKRVFRSALALANFAGTVKLNKGMILDIAKSLIGPEGLQNRDPERVFQTALVFVNIAGTVKLNETGVQTIIDSLIGFDGLQGSDPLRSYQATHALAKLAADGILNDDKMNRIIDSLTGKNGLQSSEPRRVLRASIALAGFADYPRLGKDIPQTIVELLTAKNGILRTGAPWEVFQASLVLARFADKEILDRDAKRILLKSLVGAEGLRSGNIASTFRASSAITEIAGKGMIGKDAIKALEIFLKNGDGLKSQSKFYAFLAALDIANTADRMELNNNMLGDVITLLMSSEGLQNPDPWRLIFASEALANLKARLNKLPKQPRSVDGTFDERPGKGALAAKLVIGASPYIQGLLESQGFFTLDDYKIGYEEVRRRSPELNFERMAHYWQKTARRDLAGLDIELHASGILVIDRTEKQPKYRITNRFHETLRLMKKGSESVESIYTSGIAATLKSLKPSAAGIARTVQEEKYKIFRIGSDEDYFEITDFGAAVTRLVAGGKNMIWQGAGGEKVRQDGNAFAVPGGIPVMIPANGRTPLGDMLKQDGQTPVNILKSSLARPVDGVNPLDNEACKHLLHGITDKVRWHMRNAENDSITFSITSEEVVLDVEGAKTLADIIGKVSFEQTYRLKDGRLTSELTMTNMDVAPVVLGGGYHPFYQLDDLEDWTIQVKAGKVWAKDSTPLDINAKPEDVTRGGEWDFSTPKPLRYGLEVVLSGLESEASGNVEIVLHNMKTGENRRIVFDKEHFPHVLIWVPTQDKAPAPGVFSVEPLITIPNGRNMFLSGNKEAGALVLQPGEAKTIKWELQIGSRSVENAPALTAPKLIVKPDESAAANYVARQIVDEVKRNRKAVLGLATGSTMIPVYKEVLRLTREERVSWSGVVTFNLDEYLGIPKDHPESYRSFMYKYLFDELIRDHAMRPFVIHIPDGQTADPQAELDEYVAMISRFGGVDLWLCGIGRDGHYSFLEPAPEIGLEEEELISGGKIISGDMSQPLARKLRDFNEFMITANQTDTTIVDMLARMLSIQNGARKSLGVYEDLITRRMGMAEKHGKPVTRDRAIEELNALGVSLAKNSERTFYVPRTYSESTQLQAKLSDMGYKNVTVLPQSEYFGKFAKITSLAIPTIIDNSRFFDDVSEVPLKALNATGVVVESKRIIQNAIGKDKADAVVKTLTLPPTAEVPSTILKTHPDYTIVTDEAAASLVSATTRVEFAPILQPVAATTPALVSEDEDIGALTQLASEAGGQIPTDHANRYTLLVPREFFANGEMDAHKNTYGDRFNLDAVSGSTAEQFITNVLSNPNLRKDRTIVLLPSELPNDKFGSEHYEALKAAGIRFTIVDRQQLLDARSRLLNPKQKKRELEYRKQFWVDTYAVMMLMRAMDEKTDPSSPIYRLLSFYLKTHFSFTDKIALETYIMAIAKNDIGNLLKGILAYRPIQVYDKPDYGTIAATLVSA